MVQVKSSQVTLQVKYPFSFIYFSSSLTHAKYSVCEQNELKTYSLIISVRHNASSLFCPFFLHFQACLVIIIIMLNEPYGFKVDKSSTRFALLLGCSLLLPFHWFMSLLLYTYNILYLVPIQLFFLPSVTSSMYLK